MPTLALLHTSPAHIATFDALLAELAPDVLATHLVDERLLGDARRSGLTPELRVRVAQAVDAALAAGAGAVLCTCSTIGGCAERYGAAAGLPVLRVDRAMAERAVRLGSRIAVAAALASTLGPTGDLIRDAAARVGAEVELVEVLCAGAWERFEQGDIAGYHAAIVPHLRAAACEADVVVLAQASMAGAAAPCGDLPAPVLSSPRLGLEAAVRVLRGAMSEAQSPR